VLEGALTVRPPWASPGATPIDLVIDPGQAFGTGAHATTRMCLELLLALGPASGGVVDLGCGSGVLAIAAAKLGWDPVIAVDNDPASLEATRDNATANGVAVDVRRLDLRRDPIPAAPTVVANLLAPLLEQWVERWKQDTPDRVIASGLLVAEADRVESLFAARGFTETARRTGGEWAALLMDRRSDQIHTEIRPPC
jgi:ribosomal protein L11 methyltransferase